MLTTLEISHQGNWIRVYLSYLFIVSLTRKGRIIGPFKARFKSPLIDRLLSLEKMS